MEECLRLFYAKHNPGNLENVAEITRRFRGRELELCAKLRNKYGCTPTLMQPYESVPYPNPKIFSRHVERHHEAAITFIQNRPSHAAPRLFNAIAGTFAQGPLSFLYSCLQKRRYVRVILRRVDNIRGFCTAYLKAFDKHCNLILLDVKECVIHRNMKKRNIQYRYSIYKLTTYEHDKAGGMNIESRYHEQLFVRGDNIVMIYAV
ncbi:hypothetical protein ABG067_003523 [Albugo candida]